jgi:hypothetical protein
LGTPTTPGTYNFPITVVDSTGPTPVSVAQAYTITIDPLPPPLDASIISGAMAQMAVDDGWQSTTVLVNPGASSAQAHVGYFTDDGSTFSIPLLTSPGGATATSPSVDQIMAPHSVVTIDTQGSANPPVQVGSVEVATDGRVSGYIRYRYAPRDQDALVPIETRAAASYTLAFDNTNGIATGIAVANLATSVATIAVVIRDDSGVQIRTANIILPTQGHQAFVLTDQFANTTNRSGTIEFDTPPGGRVGALGLRFPPGGRFTTIPVIASTDPGGGALAHLAVGDGWKSTIELVNNSATAASAHLKFFTDGGDALSIPLSVAGSSSTISAVDQNLAPPQRLVIDSTAQVADPLQTGSAQLTTDGKVSGFIRFRYEPRDEEAIVPIEARNAAAYILAFDNRNGVETAVAISNLGTAAVTIPVVIRDTAGSQIGSGLINIAGSGHSTFVLSMRFLPTLNQVGSVEFDPPPGGAVSVLGLRFNLAAFMVSAGATMELRQIALKLP